MKTRNAHLAASAAIVLALTAATAASAQQPAQPQPLTGPAVPGVCVFSQSEAVATSKLGRYIDQRIQTLAQQAQAEVTATRQALANDVNAYNTQKASLTQQQAEQKELELQQRNRAMQELAQRRDQELQITQQKAFGRFATEANPLFQLAMRERNCSVVFNESGVLDVAPGMNITDSVVQKLDAKITEFNFDRANLDQEIAALQAAQQGGQAAAPAAPANRPAATTPARPPATRR